MFDKFPPTVIMYDEEAYKDYGSRMYWSGAITGASAMLVLCFIIGLTVS
jgi:hypothetical protein